MNIMDEAQAFRKGKLKLDTLKESRRKAVRELSEMIDEGYEKQEPGVARYKRHNAVQRGEYIHKIRVNG